MKTKPRYACVDLDGTIADYAGWRGPDHFGAPLPGVRQALTTLREQGWVLIIFTTRGDRDRVRGYLERHAIPFDFINENPDQPPGTYSGKPFAHVYVDDRAVQFKGDWPATLAEVLAFEPWVHQDD